MALFQKILVTVDGSGSAEAALRCGLELGVLCNAQVKVLHVPHVVGEVVMAGTMPIEFPAGPELVEQAIGDVRDAVTEVSKGMKVAEPEMLIRSGDPTHEILEAAREQDADVIIMGRRGLGNVAGLLLGSVTQKVQARAGCPVLTVG
ncbi:MAG: universal stress protein [Pseudomonadota bacterium]